MSAYIPATLQQKIRAQFSDCCAYCRTAEFLTATTFELEHIVPVSLGGKTIHENLCLACPTCNRSKAVRQAAIDPETNETVLLFSPQQQLWEDHFQWNVDSTKIVPLTPTGRATCSALKMNRLQLVRVRKLWVSMEEHPPKIS